MHAVIGVLLASLGCNRSYADSLAALPAEGSPVPAFTLPLLSGGAVSPSQLRGHTVVLALWSSTCGASRIALASMAALHSEYSTRGVRVLVLADDKDISAVQSVLDSAGITIPVALATGQLASILSPSKPMPWMPGLALPAFLVIDSSGIVQARILGIEQDAAKHMDRVRSAVDDVAEVERVSARGRPTPNPRATRYPPGAAALRAEVAVPLSQRDTKAWRQQQTRSNAAWLGVA